MNKGANELEDKKPDVVAVNEKSFNAILEQLGYRPDNLITSVFIKDNNALIYNLDHVVKPIVYIEKDDITPYQKRIEEDIFNAFGVPSTFLNHINTNLTRKGE